MTRRMPGRCTCIPLTRTASLQAIAHFLTQRLGDDAQEEIQRYAVAVRDLVLPLFPHSLPRLLQG